MCGICGFFSKKNISPEELKVMNDTMFHRGPNDSGEELYSFGEYTLGLAQRRLSILDLSPLGHQPMHSADRRVSIVFNGEIYNFRELRRELGDYPFVSSCDTEVLLAAYEKWGEEFVNRIHGMFAIALFDRKNEKLLLIRDRIGKKPLYYWSDGQDIVFASELKPILACPGFPRELNREVLPDFLLHSYVNAPESVFRNVYKLQPGTMLIYHYGEKELRKYWDVADVYDAKKEQPVRSFDEAKETLKELLTRSVQKRMIADVPLGSFLSGGYDSSLITAIAQSVSDTPVKTFCIGFDTPEYNEAEYALQVAKHLGTDHKELYVGEQEMFDLVQSIPQFFDEPFADSSQIPTMLVSKLAKEDVTVVLSGDGGDELFCGYNVYTKIDRARKLDGLGALTYGFCNLPGIRQTNLSDRLPFSVRTIAGNRNPNTKTQFGCEKYMAQIHKLLPDLAEPSKFPEERYHEKNWQIRRMLLDEDTYLPGDILCKVDRASMKYSLETRCPILDTDVIEYSYRLPQRFKYLNGDKKHILKEIVYDYIPKELLDRPKKGFSVPLDKWLRGPLREELTTYAGEEFLKKQNLFDPVNTEQFIAQYLKTGDRGSFSGENFSKTAWAFFIFQQWYAHYLA